MFTWSIGDAVEAALGALDLEARSPVGLPAYAPEEVRRAIGDAGHVVRVIDGDPETLGWNLDALREAVEGSQVAAVVAWRLAGAPFPEAVRHYLATAPIPVIEASPRMACRGERRLPGSTATCVSLAEPGRSAAVLVTDHADHADHADLATGDPTDRAALDRWAATVHPHLGPPFRRRGTTEDLRPPFELLVDALQHIERAQLHCGPAIGWGEAPSVLLVLHDPTRRHAVLDRLGEVAAITVSPCPAGHEHGTGHANGVGAPDPIEITVRRSLSDDEARRLATIAESPDDLDGPEPATPTAITTPVPPAPPMRFGARLTKRAFDLTVASVSIVVLAPLLAIIAALVKIFDGGPVLFRQVRVGRNGRTFEMLKFRTMVVGADRSFGHYSFTNERTGPLFKVTNDPRATTLGKVLRRTSLDELPQLFNVVGGTMSLVGPRPPLPRERALFAPELLARESVRPGITGLWQVEARDDSSFERYAELDLRYLATWSLADDLALLSRTPAAVLRSALRRRPRRIRSRTP